MELIWKSKSISIIGICNYRRDILEYSERYTQYDEIVKLIIATVTTV